MIILFDIGNTNTHIGVANDKRVVRYTDIPTATWLAGKAANRLRNFVGKTKVEGAVICSVVPRATPKIQAAVVALWKLRAIELTPKTLQGVGIDYPKPETIGPDRLANAVAARHRFGTPSVVVDFGTAVTFDVVDARGNYVGGIIAPGLAAMTDYLHEKTALLPRIRIREVKSLVGKSTEHAMHGEFDSGSERTLAAWIRHASRTGSLLGSNIQVVGVAKGA
jgi:type III pantothenate kinase